MIRRFGWLIAGVLGGTMTLLIMVVLPPDRTIDNLGDFLLKISPVVFAVLAIAGFPQRPSLGLALLGVLVVGYMGVLDTMYVLRVLAFAEDKATFTGFYQISIFVNAFTMLAVLFGYRLGGASAKRVLRLGFAATLVLISGLNDLTFYYLYDWADGRPERLDWASHISVFVGGSPTADVAITFCAIHLFLAALILAWPAWRRRAQPTAEAGISGGSDGLDHRAPEPESIKEV